MKAILTKEDLFSIVDQNIKSIKVDKWKRTIYIREMDGKRRVEYESQIVERSSKKDQMSMASFVAVLLVFTLCDPEGNYLFNIEDKENLEIDIENISKKNYLAQQEIFFEAAKLNGVMTKEFEVLEKNLKRTRRVSSRTN